jgi:hypothetical protein
VERGILDACAPLISMLEELLGHVYRNIYNESVSATPAFRLYATPTLPLEQFQVFLFAFGYFGLLGCITYILHFTIFYGGCRPHTTQTSSRR